MTMTIEPSTERSAKFDRYANDRKISGWAFDIIYQSLNLPYLIEQGQPLRRMTEWVERFDDTCRVRDTPLIHCSSLIKDTDLFVVWIVDQHNGRWHVSYRAKNCIFGGGGNHDTLEEAIEAYDARRGHQPEPLSLF